MSSPQHQVHTTASKIKSEFSVTNLPKPAQNFLHVAAALGGLYCTLAGAVLLDRNFEAEHRQRPAENPAAISGLTFYNFKNQFLKLADDSVIHLQKSATSEKAEHPSNYTYSFTTADGIKHFINAGNMDLDKFRNNGGKLSQLNLRAGRIAGESVTFDIFNQHLIP